MKPILFLFALTFSVSLAFAQDSLEVGHRMNTIKVDLTHNLIYRNAYNFSWERIMKKNQTLGITLGYQEFPKLTNLGENIQAKKERNSGGYKVGAEYRFYLQKENRHAAPRGVYIGPYFSALGFDTTRDIIFNGGDSPQEATAVTRIGLYSLGAQLGYQFVFNDRWSLDLVLVGPSLTRYDLRMKMDGNFDFDPNELQQTIADALVQKFPGLEDLLQDKELDSSGRLDVTGLGYRYQFLIGYRFGKKFKKN